MDAQPGRSTRVVADRDVCRSARGRRVRRLEATRPILGDHIPRAAKVVNRRRERQRALDADGVPDGRLFGLRLAVPNRRAWRTLPQRAHLVSTASSCSCVIFPSLGTFGWWTWQSLY